VPDHLRLARQAQGGVTRGGARGDPDGGTTFREMGAQFHMPR